MKYIRTYETEEKFLTDKGSTSRGFRLKPTLYKYSEAGDHVQLELDDPRKHEGSTYMEITLDSNDLSYNAEFSFYIGNAPDDTQTTMTCTIDWGDGTVETKTITKDDKGFKLAHNYTAGSYKIELYNVERDYSMVGDGTNYISVRSHPSSIKRVVLGSDLVSIGACMFYKCYSLTSVHIPESVTSIGNNVFASCKSLTSVHIPEGVTIITSDAFYNCQSLSSVNIPESVTKIYAAAFSNCYSLTSIHIPKGVTTMYSTVFYNCKSLSSVNIPEGVTNIDSETFAYCRSLTSIRTPKNATIGNKAFQSCSSLISPYISEGTDYVGMQAFEGCSSLISISSLGSTAPSLSNKSFSKLPTNGTLHIKPGATGYDKWLSKLHSGWTIVEDL